MIGRPLEQPTLHRIQFDGALVVQDSTRGRLWVLEGEAAQAVAAADEALAAAALDRVGLVAGQRQSTVACAPPRSPPALEMTVAEGGPPVRVRCWPSAIAPTLSHALAPLAATGPIRTTIDLLESSDGPVVAVDGQVVHRPGSVAMGRWLLLRRLASEIAPRRQTLVCVHGAGVDLSGSVALLAGRSGAGKTTLAAGLIASGATLLADDLTPIEARTRLAFPFPMAMSIKDGAWPVASALFPDLHMTPEVHAAGRAVRYLPAPRRTPPGVGRKVAALLFPRFTPGHAATSSPIRPATALRRLVEAGTWPPANAEDLDDFLEWLSGLAIHELVYGDLADGISLTRACI